MTLHTPNFVLFLNYSLWFFQTAKNPPASYFNKTYDTYRLQFFLNESTAVTQLFNKLTLEDEEPK